MGAWGSGIFDNDTAMDFVGGLTGMRNWSVVLDRINAPLAYPAFLTHLPARRLDGSLPGTLETASHEEFDAAAALEVVASALGVPGRGFGESAMEIASWVQRHPVPDRSYIPHLARLVADSIAGAPPSAIWVDGGRGWQKSMGGLAARLHRATIVTPEGDRRSRAWRALLKDAPQGALVLLEGERSLSGALSPADLVTVLQRPEAWARDIGVRTTAPQPARTRKR